MKISDLVSALQFIRSVEGDLDVVLYDAEENAHDSIYTVKVKEKNKRRDGPSLGDKFVVLD